MPGPRVPPRKKKRPTSTPAPMVTT
jgi:hypothetical protein